MSNRVWAIKLGSGGKCVSFCERHKIVGVGWKQVNPKIVAGGKKEELYNHIQKTCSFYNSKRDVGGATGQLFRFGQECGKGDYILYYNPPQKQVQICRVISESRFRDFEPDDENDIWHYRQIEYAGKPISILDFHGNLKGTLLGPRMSFWSMGDVYESVNQIASGKSPSRIAAPDLELQKAYEKLRELVKIRLGTLNDADWEWLVVDYFKAQGAFVDERKVGRSQPIIDAEAIFSHGELGDEKWRIQVKLYKNKKVEWREIEKDFRHIDEGQFCYVAAFGFSEDAKIKAAEAGIRLMEAEDFVYFILSGHLRLPLKQKLNLPNW